MIGCFYVYLWHLRRPEKIAEGKQNEARNGGLPAVDLRCGATMAVIANIKPLYLSSNLPSIYYINRAVSFSSSFSSHRESNHLKRDSAASAINLQDAAVNLSTADFMMDQRRRSLPIHNILHFLAKVWRTNYAKLIFGFFIVFSI